MSIKYIDKVISFDSTEGLHNTIKWYQPDIMVIGSDWKGKEVVGEQYAAKLIFFDRIEGYSTTKILEWETNCFDGKKYYRNPSEKNNDVKKVIKKRPYKI